MEMAANLIHIAGATVSYVWAHPIQAVSAVSIGLTPVLGPGWLVALPLKAVGFGAAGVGGGKWMHCRWMIDELRFLGTIAAWWQASAYGGYVPAGSVFAVLQAAGATMGI